MWIIIMIIILVVLPFSYGSILWSLMAHDDFRCILCTSLTSCSGIPLGYSYILHHSQYSIMLQVSIICRGLSNACLKPMKTFCVLWSMSFQVSHCGELINYASSRFEPGLPVFNFLCDLRIHSGALSLAFEWRFRSLEITIEIWPNSTDSPPILKPLQDFSWLSHCLEIWNALMPL